MKSLCGLCLSILASIVSAQAPTWHLDPYDDRYFIENIGQYDPVGGEAVHCGVDDNGTEIFYTATGFTYRLRKPIAVPAYVVADRSEEPENEREDHTRLWYDTLQIHAHWVGATPSTIGLEAPQTAVFHFAKNGAQLVGAKGYERLVYKDLYPQVDLAYRFHEIDGIKYDLTVRPGGDVDQIVLAWDGMQHLVLDDQGRLHARLGDAELIDQAPSAYLLESGQPVAIAYALQGNQVRFQTAPYDRSQTLVIDPWIINPGFTTEGKVFDVGWDCAGNVYAFGGRSPWKIKQFNSAGALQWTYNTSHIDWYGDMISDNLGNVYLIEGCCNGNRQKLNSAGVVQWTINNGVYEFWRLAFSCDYSRLTMATAYTASAAVVQGNSLSTINMSSGAISGSVTVAGTEPRALSGAASGNYYVLTSVGNELVARNTTYAPVYNTSNGYSLLYNGPLYANGTNSTSGQNGLAIYSNFIFTSNGATVMKRDITTGALLASAAIPGGTSEQYSGIAVDNCGNVFVGGNANVYRYDVNLAPVATIPLSGAIYDVAVSGTAQLLVAGNGMLASQTAPCVAPCHTCVILPVSLDRWDVTANSRHHVDIHWSVATPQAYIAYTVERSPDALHYLPLQTVTAGPATHALVDPSPFQGYSWYRLALQDHAGQVTYGPVQQVWVGDAPKSLLAFPNPAHDRLQVQFSGANHEAGMLELLSAQGQVVSRWTVEDAGQMGTMDLNIAELASGLYTLRFTGVGFAPVSVLKVDQE